MTRHIADHPTGPEEGRMLHFAEVERRDDAAGPHPAARTVHARPLSRAGSTRLKEFTRIDRGHEA